MDYAEKMIALENMIAQYASTQFGLNNIAPTQAILIMSGVVSRIQNQCIDNLIMSRVTICQTDEPNKNTDDVQKEEAHV